MSTESGDQSVNGSNGTGAVNSGNATSGVTAELRNEIQKVVMGIFREQVPRAVKSAVTETMPDLLKTALGEFQQPAKQEQVRASGASTDDSQRLSMKALESQLADLKQQLVKRDEALTAERQRVVDSQMRGQVREALSAALGADSKALGFVMDSLYDTKKRFVQDEHGEALIKFRSTMGGDDELLPLKDGVKRLMEGELSHFAPSKTANLPNTARPLGQSMINSKGNGTRPGVIDRLLGDAANSALRAAEGKE